MPYRWSSRTQSDRPTQRAELDAWPYQSMTPSQFVTFMGATLVLVAMPLLTVLGSPILWFLLFFFALAIWGLWFAIGRQKRAANLLEHLSFGPKDVTLVRRQPGQPDKVWEANRYWVSVHLHEDGGPVEKYLTLKGGGREVELGAFLSPEERVSLYDELQVELAKR